jgi:hypothetical protein
VYIGISLPSYIPHGQPALLYLIGVLLNGFYLLSTHPPTYLPTYLLINLPTYLHLPTCVIIVLKPYLSTSVKLFVCKPSRDPASSVPNCKKPALKRPVLIFFPSRGRLPHCSFSSLHIFRPQPSCITDGTIRMFFTL